MQGQSENRNQSQFPSVLAVDKIYKKYGRREVLRGASFYADQGECICIVGSNGCGKSTLLGILAGCLKFQTGNICYYGRDPLSDKKTFAELIGYVPQDNPLMEQLSVKDNLSFWYCDTGKNLKQELASGLPARFGLTEYADTAVSKLSGGMKKRLSIACALTKDPPILIMDEPGASLDLICKQQIKEYLISYLAQGGTVLLTSHEESELALASRMYLLDQGTLHELAHPVNGTELMHVIERGIQ